MIIAAYAGAGKSTFEEKVPNSIDMVSMPYRWVLPQSKPDKGESEEQKAAEYLVENPFFVYQYVHAILKAEEEYDYVIIPTIGRIIRYLIEDFDRQVVVCCPSIFLKDEYAARYDARGNSEIFKRIFIDYWEKNICDIMDLCNHENVIGIIMESGQYLSDLEPKLSELRGSYNVNSKVLKEAMEALDNQLQRMEDSLYVNVYFEGKIRIHSIKSIDDSEERKFIYELGKLASEKGMQSPYIRRYESISKYYVNENYEVIESRDEFIEKIKSLPSIF